MHPTSLTAHVAAAREQDLRRLTPGSIVTPGHLRWEALAGGAEPAFVAVPRTAADLATITAFAREHGFHDDEVLVRTDELAA
jgi:hypothetical protein